MILFDGNDKATTPAVIYSLVFFLRTPVRFLGIARIAFESSHSRDKNLLIDSQSGLLRHDPGCLEAKNEVKLK